MDKEIREKLEQISKKYKPSNEVSEYVSFNFAIHSYGGKKWTVYTPIVGHNEFDSREGMVTFLDGLLGASETYKNHKREQLMKKRELLSAELRDAERGIERLGENREPTP